MSCAKSSDLFLNVSVGSEAVIAKIGPQRLRGTLGVPNPTPSVASGLARDPDSPIVVTSLTTQ